MVRLFAFAFGMIVVTAVVGGATALGDPVQCYKPVPTNENCTEYMQGVGSDAGYWFKCDTAPSSPSYCGDPEYDGQYRACVVTYPNCGGDKFKYLSEEECGASGEIVGVSSCTRTYSFAEAVPGNVQCL